MKKLAVHYCGWGAEWPLGMLADNGKHLLFEYAPAALAQGLELSPLHLPLRATAFGPFPDFQWGLPGLIADALPDGWGLLLMDRLFRKNGIDPARLSVLDRLAFIGARAIGGLRFVPAETLASDGMGHGLLELAQASQTLLKGKDVQVLKDLVRLGGSPQGARPKVLLDYDCARAEVASGDGGMAATPWLFKFQASGEHKEVCAIEHLYARLARDCGLDMPRTVWLDLDKNLAAFGIERFDRSEGMRVPVHTLAGALQQNFRLPSESYASLLRMTRLMTRDQRELHKAFERCVFNVLFHNRDDHTKNFSFRLDRDQRWKLAPCYDLTFNHGMGGEHAMDIAGEGRKPGKAQLLQLAGSEGLDMALANQSLECMAAVAANFRQIAQDYPIRTNTRKQIGAAINAVLLLM